MISFVSTAVWAIEIVFARGRARVTLVTRARVRGESSVWFHMSKINMLSWKLK